MKTETIDVRELQASVANEALREYRFYAEMPTPGTPEECEIELACLLSDLQRWANEVGVDFDVALGMADESVRAQERIYKGPRIVPIDGGTHIARWRRFKASIVRPAHVNE